MNLLWNNTRQSLENEDCKATLSRFRNDELRRAVNCSDLTGNEGRVLIPCAQRTQNSEQTVKSSTLIRGQSPGNITSTSLETTRV